jgi:hypothetical protein
MNAGKKFGVRRESGAPAMRGSIGWEIVLVLAVFVAGVVLASTLFIRLRQNARNEHFAADLLARSAALEEYHNKTGRWPAAAWEGGAPAGINAYLSGIVWSEESPLGGHYVWAPPAGREPGLLSVTAFDSDAPLKASPPDLRAIDIALDDGDLGNGRFRTGFNGWPVWRVGP